MRILVFGSILVLLLAPTSNKAETEESPFTSNLLPYNIVEGHAPYTLADRMEHYRVPGVGIAVIQDFGVVWSGYFGRKKAGSHEPVDAETIFGMGSLSKAVCSAGILNLARSGQIDIDADINPQLKSWQVPDHPWSGQSEVTPALLMSHTGGLPHRPPVSYPADNIPTVLQMVNGQPPSRLGPLAVTLEPGKQFQYSNGGFTILEILTVDVDGRPFPEAVASRVILPLGMRRTTFATPLPADRLPFAATGHRHNGTPIDEPRPYMAHVAAGGLWSTAEDYARFLIEIQRAATGRSAELLDRDQALRMVSPGPSSKYGLGVFLYEGNGSEPYFSHIGDGAGFVAGFIAHREKGFGAVITTNASGGINLCREVMRSVAAVQDWPGYLPLTRPDLPLSGQEIDELAGRYATGFDQNVRLESRDGHLFYTPGEGAGMTLYQVARDTFVALERKGEIAVDRSGAEPLLLVHLSDEIGRLGGVPAPATRLKPGELSPFEQLCRADASVAYQPYLSLAERQPDHPALAEARLNRLGYRHLGRDQLEEALRIFKLNTLLHPESGNVFDSYGEALFAAGKNDEAAHNYRRSLELNPKNSNAVRVLEEIAGDTKKR